MNALILRLDAPMMSFGGVVVDQHGFIDRFPGNSLLCGLIANALGWHHGDYARLQDLQSRIKYAARWDVKPERIIDYHTVDLGQAKMTGYAPTNNGQPKESDAGGWTTSGEPEHRFGGKGAKFGTHQRYRHYWTDGLMTVALTLTGDHDPDLNSVEAALRHPGRPLFLGRKTCLPSRPLLDPKTPQVEGENVLAVLQQVDLWGRRDQRVLTSGLEACWPAELGVHQGEVRRVYDQRDWANQIPAGSSQRAEGLI